MGEGRVPRFRRGTGPQTIVAQGHRLTGDLAGWEARLQEQKITLGDGQKYRRGRGRRELTWGGAYEGYLKEIEVP